MNFLICIFSFWCIIKNFSYCMYEFNENKNIIGAICIGVFNIVTFIFVNTMLFLN